MDLFKATLSRKTGDAGEKVSVKGLFDMTIWFSLQGLICLCASAAGHDAEAHQNSSWPSRW